MKVYQELDNIPIDHTIQVTCDSIVPVPDDHLKEFVISYHITNKNNTFGGGPTPPHYLNTARIRIRKEDGVYNWIIFAETINGIDIKDSDRFKLMIPLFGCGDFVDVAHVYTTVWNDDFYHRHCDILKYIQR